MATKVKPAHVGLLSVGSSAHTLMLCVPAGSRCCCISAASLGADSGDSCRQGTGTHTNTVTNSSRLVSWHAIPQLTVIDHTPVDLSACYSCPRQQPLHLHPPASCHCPPPQKNIHPHTCVRKLMDRPSHRARVRP
jgi:hypothetical protein